MRRVSRRAVIAIVAILFITVCGAMGWRYSNRRLLQIAESVHVGQTEEEVGRLIGRPTMRANTTSGEWMGYYGTESIRGWLNDFRQYRTFKRVSNVVADWPLYLEFDRDGVLTQIQRYGELVEWTPVQDDSGDR